MTKKCKQCSSKDPAYKVFVMLQTVSFLCCQTMIPVPYAGMHAHFVRGKSSWWDEIA